MPRLRTTLEIVRNNGSDRFKAASAPFNMTGSTVSYGYANTLIESATQNNERKTQTPVDYDFHRTLSETGRRTLVSLARSLYWKIAPLQASISEQANLAASPFTGRFAGTNKAWGEQASAWLNNWHRVMCLEGWPYDYESFCEQQVSAPITDGDVGTLLTEDASGNPRVQTIPTHRIGLRYSANGQAKVRYEGNTLLIDGQVIDDSLPYSFSQPVEWDAPVISGVIVDAQFRPLAYRVYDDPPTTGGYRDIGARSMFLSFSPMVPGQLRGIPLLASSVWDWQDWREFKSWELLAQKAFSTKTIVETNETGEVDEAKAIIQSAGTFNTDASAATIASQKLEAGTMTYLKAKTGSKLEAFNWQDRPGRNSQDFQEMTMRDAFAGSEWSMFFSLDPKQVGGAPMRVIVDRLNRVLKKRRRNLSKAVLRVDAWALSKAIKRGDLPFDPEWFKWTYQGQPDITADRRYDQQCDQAEYELGWSNLQDVEERRSGDWQLKREQREREVDDLYERARRISNKHGIPIQEAAAHLSMMGNAYVNLGENVADADLKDTQKPVDSKGNPIDTTK